MRVAKTGGAPELVADKQLAPYPIALDDAFVYWATGQGTLSKAPKTGNASPTILAAVARPSGIIVDGDIIYVANVDGVTSGSKSGGPRTTLFPARASAMPSIAVDQDAVYVGVYGSAIRIPKAGGPNSSFPTGLGSGSGPVVVVDASYLYTVGDTLVPPNGPGAGTNRASKSMDPISRYPISVLQDSPVAIDTDYIYENLSKVAKCGGGIIRVRPGRANGIAVDADRIYWTAPGLVGAALK
jgi:hypothetical protein